MGLTEEDASRARVLYGRQRRLWAEMEALERADQLIVGPEGDWPRMLSSQDGDGDFQTLHTCLRLRVQADITAAADELSGLGFAPYEHKPSA